MSPLLNCPIWYFSQIHASYLGKTSCFVCGLVFKIQPTASNIYFQLQTIMVQITILLNRICHLVKQRILVPMILTEYFLYFKIRQQYIQNTDQTAMRFILAMQSLNMQSK